jgi:flagellin
MSFRVNTNVTAMNALRNLGATNEQFSKSISRLSTGLRINSAADDPAGLIASEGFRAQITGLNQAVQNSQDAINYTKTAEGALGEVNTLLRDARGLAVAAGNTGTLTSAQTQANQNQLKSISDSISRIASTTQYGTKKLLDGSSGVTASVADATKVESLSIGGSFGSGTAVSANGAVSITVTQAATQAVVASRDFGATDATASGVAGAFTINGVTFQGSATDTAATLRDKINSASAQTGVVAVTNDSGVISLQTSAYGSQARIDLTDSAGVISSSAGYTGQAGTAALATVKVGTATALFTGSTGGADGLTLSDAQGNTIRLTSAGNATSVANATVGQVVVGNAQFQIGANAGQSTSLSLANFASSNLGGGAVSGLNLSNLDLTTAAGADNALKVIDAAIDQVTKARGQIGNFQRNVLESNIRSLGTAKENLSASESSIRDTDVAQEMTNYTKQQILQQAGLSVLAQANSAPQNVLSLLK